MSVVQEVGCPPDQLEVDVVAAFFFDVERPINGAAGLLDRRLGLCLSRCLIELGADLLPQRMLVKASDNIAASWVLFCPGGEQPPKNDAEICSLLTDLLEGCDQSGFRRIAVAPPVSANEQKKEWLACLESILGGQKSTVVECLVSFDDAYLHDHSAPVLDI